MNKALELELVEIAYDKIKANRDKMQNLLKKMDLVLEKIKNRKEKVI